MASKPQKKEGLDGLLEWAKGSGLAKWSRRDKKHDMLKSLNASIKKCLEDY